MNEKVKIVADTHTHTLASTHAFSTLLENARFAGEIGLDYLAITDHAPNMTDAPHRWHFENLRIVPNELYGVKLLKGAEVNILDEDGSLDLSEDILNQLDWLVASFHVEACAPMTVEQHTKAYLSIAQNPKIDVIGHSGREIYRYDYERAIKAFKEYDKLVEINQNSFVARKDSHKNCVEIAKLCKKYEVKVVVNSDAHFAYSIGQVDDALGLLEEIEFPRHLIVNSSLSLFEEYLNQR